jgi:ADP-ribose pyrophosphatase YjhB (NUDIX family)
LSHKRHSHCHACGAPYGFDVDHYAKCGACGTETWINPAPVSIPIIPAGNGIVMVRRKIKPGFGKLSFPGGYITGRLRGKSEHWRDAAAREAREEAGVIIDPAKLVLFDVYSVEEPGGPLLLFCRYDGWIDDKALPPFVGNDEASERVILTGKYGPTGRILTAEQRADIAFSSHADVAIRWFDECAFTDDVE